MPALKISADWEHLDRGLPEERACFAAVGIICNDRWLTEGVDGFVNRIRTEPLLSAYHLAEWLAWNWWRLRWEPRSAVADWALAHQMSSIGEGYIWPNITIFSDGERTALIAKAGRSTPTTPFRYVSNHAAIVPSREFESAVDEFVTQVIGQLRAEQLVATNLNRLWSELLEERQDPVASQRRKLEALLGFEPDEAPSSVIDRLLVDGPLLGQRAIEELAANSAQGGGLPTANELEERAKTRGYACVPRDAVRLTGSSLPFVRDVPPWKLGAEGARALRAQEQLGDKPITNTKLTELAGVESRTLSGSKGDTELAFILDKNETHGRVVLRSRRKPGQRFELARLLADRIVASPVGRLHTATRAHTYRQKMQRSFAAELLSPFDAVDAMLDGDYSAEAQADVADYFQVSSLTIRTILVNHHRIDREELDDEFDIVA